MKTLFRRLIVLATVILSSPIPALAQGETPAAAAINIIVPDLYMTPATGGEETRLIAPSTFEAGETLRSDSRGVALITWFYDGTESVLDANSVLTLHTFTRTAEGGFVIDLELGIGHLVNGLGTAHPIEGESAWTLTTPAFTVRLLEGQFEVTVAADGATLLIVTAGRVEVAPEGRDPVIVSEGQYLTGEQEGVGEPTPFAGDGLRVKLPQACTVTANTNLNVRAAPNEASRRLGGVSEGQVLWVHAGTEGNLWLQVYFPQAAGPRFGWIYGPAGTLGDHCDHILRAPLDAMLLGGDGIGERINAEGGGKAE